MRRQFFQVLCIILVAGTLGAVSPAWSDWLQPPDLTANGVAVRVSSPPALADNFQAAITGPITDIYIYISSNDSHAYLPNFTLGIWNDIPATSTTPSMPGTNLWLQALIFSDQYQVSSSAINPPGTFYDPTGAISADVGSLWQYHFSFTPGQAFVATAGQTYWLSATGWTDGPYGWQSTDPGHQWTDDAVWTTDWSGDTAQNWQALRYSTGQSMDLAFGITSTPIPATLPLLGSGLLGLAAWRRFRKS
jgi:hypothetical protein